MISSAGGAAGGLCCPHWAAVGEQQTHTDTRAHSGAHLGGSCGCGQAVGHGRGSRNPVVVENTPAGGRRPKCPPAPRCPPPRGSPAKSAPAAASGGRVVSTPRPRPYSRAHDAAKRARAQTTCKLTRTHTNSYAQQVPHAVVRANLFLLRGREDTAKVK